MIVELPEKLEAALKIQANAHGVSSAGYVCEVLEREVAPSQQGAPSPNGAPGNTGADLVEAMQASPYKEVALESSRGRMPVRDVTF